MKGVMYEVEEEIHEILNCDLVTSQTFLFSTRSGYGRRSTFEEQDSFFAGQL